MTRDEEIRVCIEDAIKKYGRKIASDFLGHVEKFMSDSSSSGIDTVCSMTNIKPEEITPEHVTFLGYQLLALAQVVLDKVKENESGKVGFRINVNEGKGVVH
jgi:hypothetical protein